MQRSEATTSPARSKHNGEGHLVVPISPRRWSFWIGRVHKDRRRDTSGSDQTCSPSTSARLHRCKRGLTGDRIPVEDSRRVFNDVLLIFMQSAGAFCSGGNRGSSAVSIFHNLVLCGHVVVFGHSYGIGKHPGNWHSGSNFEHRNALASEACDNEEVDRHAQSHHRGRTKRGNCGGPNFRST